MNKRHLVRGSLRYDGQVGAGRKGRVSDGQRGPSDHGHDAPATQSHFCPSVPVMSNIDRHDQPPSVPMRSASGTAVTASVPGLVRLRWSRLVAFAAEDVNLDETDSSLS